MMPTDDELPAVSQPIQDIASRMACEGIPVAAIARALAQPSDLVLGSLKQALHAGSIASIPKFDWPPTSKLEDHIQCHSTEIPEADLIFITRQYFKLSPLEAAFLVMFLRNDHADKDRLHSVVEHQRFTRAQNPDRIEPTDPKMVDVMICKLRKRMKAIDPTFKIETVWGSGYFIEPPVRTAIMSRLAEEAARAKRAGS